MGKINGKDVKENILKFLKEHGPSLPVSVAKRVSLNSIFASAFLSELSAEGLVKISNMKVGGSPLYYTPETLPQLENSIHFLNQKEKEACHLLKQYGILQDSLQQPAIRIALRGLKDFAIPFKQDADIFWRYFLFSEQEVRNKLQEIPQKPIKIEIKAETIKEPQKQEIVPIKIEPQITNSQIPIEIEIKPQVKLEEHQRTITGEPLQEIIPKKKYINKKEKPKPEKFLGEVKSHLTNKNIEILKIDFFDKKRVIGKMKINNTECLFFAFDKKRIDEKEMIKAWKKAASLNLPYYIFTREDHSKKLKDMIDATKAMLGSEKIPNSEA